jgi:hypothetical protein
MADSDGGGAAAPVRAKKDGGFGLGKKSGFGVSGHHSSVLLIWLYKHMFCLTSW